MYYYIDESGNTGLNLFDANQPKLFYGVLGCSANLDVIAEPLLTELRKELGVRRIHAAELGVGRLIPIAKRIADFSKKHDRRFFLLAVTKEDHAVISFYDQVFDLRNEQGRVLASLLHSPSLPNANEGRIPLR